MYPANRIFFLAWLLALTKWFAWLDNAQRGVNRTTTQLHAARTALQILLKAAPERDLCSY